MVMLTKETATTISPQTRQLLNDVLPDELTVDAKLRRLLETEYLRELARYRRTDLALSRKYNFSFDEFLAQNVVQQRDYSWEVEQDAMVWETAVGGMATVERKLRELQALNNQSLG